MPELCRFFGIVLKSEWERVKGGETPRSIAPLR